MNDITTPRDYESIKQLAKLTGRKITDYLVLAPQNDPFYMGAPGNRRDAEWFAFIYCEYGIRAGAHIRQIHYKVSSASSPPKTPDGEIYTNTDECWCYVQRASKAARYLGLVDPESFEDRKNPPAIICREQPSTMDDSTVRITESELCGLDELPEELELPRLLAPAFHPTQTYHLEIWCEKTTMNDVLVPLCQDYGANLVTGAGELTLTAVSNFVQRCRECHPARLFYISDFDPAGKTMPVSVARKVEFLLRSRPGLDVRVYPIVLTADQCRNFQLPRIPIKESERRKGKFESIHGGGATELDAMEALYPGKLREIVTAELGRYFDTTLQNRCDEAYRDCQADLDAECATVYAEHREEIDALQSEYGKARETLRAVKSKSESLWQTIRDKVEALEVDIDDPPKPSPVYVEAPAMFDSGRSWDQQLEAYRLFKEGKL